jgi:hypothetical protein
MDPTEVDAFVRGEHHRMLVAAELPRHRLLRQGVPRAFGNAMVDAVAAQVQQLLDTAVTRLLDRGGADFATEVATEHPPGALMAVVGIGHDDAHELIRRTRCMVGYRDDVFVDLPADRHVHLRRVATQDAERHGVIIRGSDFRHACDTSRPTGPGTVSRAVRLRRRPDLEPARDLRRQDPPVYPSPMPRCRCCSSGCWPPTSGCTPPAAHRRLHTAGGIRQMWSGLVLGIANLPVRVQAAWPTTEGHG